MKITITFLNRILKTLDWMVATIKWQQEQILPSDRGFPIGTEPDYSPELREAMKVQKELSTYVRIYQHGFRDSSCSGCSTKQSQD